MPRVPAALVGLLAGTVAYHAASRTFPGASLGSTFASAAAGLPFREQFGVFQDLVAVPAYRGLALDVIATAFTLALVSSIRTLISAAAVDGLFAARHDSNRELLGHGLANTLSGCFGGLIGDASFPHTRVAHEAGARTRLSGVFVGVGIGIIGIVLTPLLRFLPVPVMAAVILMIAVDVLRGWTGHLVRRFTSSRGGHTRRQLMADLHLVAFVAVLVVFLNVLVAVGIGMVIAFLMFLRTASRSIVHRSYGGDQVHSLTARPSSAMGLLEWRGSVIRVFELQGPLFFGSADELAREIDDVMEASETIILDLRRVIDVDSTGAVILDRLDTMLARKGRTLLIAHVPPGSDLFGFLTEIGLKDARLSGRFHPDTESALAWAENQLLLSLAPDLTGEGQARLEHVELFQGLSSDEMKLVVRLLKRSTHATGDRIISEGQQEASMHVLVKGRVSVRKRARHGGRSIRLASFLPGTTFGEIAFLSSQPRTADIEADEDVVCYQLSTEAFEALRRERPEIALQIMNNIARILAHRLGTASTAIASLE